MRTVPPDLVFFVYESGYRVIRGRLLFLMAKWMDGKRTVADLVQRLDGKLSVVDIAAGLQLFEAEGVLADATEGAPSGIDLYCDTLGAKPKAFERKLQSTRLQILSFGSVPASEFVSLLQDSPLQISSPSNLTVVLVDDYLSEELERFNRKMIRKRYPWIILKPVGTVLWIGPIFSPVQTACWMCMAIRLKEKRRVDAFVNSNTRKYPVDAPYEVVPFAAGVAANLACLQLMKWISGGENRGAGKLLTFDLKDMKLEEHTVAQRPDCAECGTSRASFPARISIRSRKRHDGLEPERIFDRYAHHISIRTGIVDGFESYSTEPIHSVAADHLFVPVTEKKNVLQKGLTQKSWGRGTTEYGAKTGALCEALERYSGIFRGNEFRILKRYEEFPDQAISLNACLNFSRQQYKQRANWNKSHSEQDQVPVPFQPSKKIEWSPVWSLTHKAFKYLPTAYCYYGYPLNPQSRFCRADSNGNAAGETLEDAIWNGFLEVVERDCAAIWWYNKLQKPAVLLESFDVPYFRTVCDYYQSRGRKLWVLDLTADLQIPCFAAVSSTRNNKKPQWLIGLGAGLDPAEAIVRALTEMNQFFAAGRGTRTRKTHSTPTPPFDYLRPDPQFRAVTANDYQKPDPGDVGRNLRTCVTQVRKAGMEMLVLDQTRSDVGMPVVKVIIPGMRNIRPRFGAGRLYEIPVRMGWMAQPWKENQLNPSSFLI